MRLYDNRGLRKVWKERKSQSISSENTGNPRIFDCFLNLLVRLEKFRFCFFEFSWFLTFMACGVIKISQLKAVPQPAGEGATGSVLESARKTVITAVAIISVVPILVFFWDVFS